MVAPVKVKRVRVVEVPGLGDRLEKARIDAEKSVSAVCRDAGISRNYWYKLVEENIEGALSEETLIALESALETTFEVEFEA